MVGVFDPLTPKPTKLSRFSNYREPTEETAIKYTCCALLAQKRRNKVLCLDSLSWSLVMPPRRKIRSAVQLTRSNTQRGPVFKSALCNSFCREPFVSKSVQQFCDFPSVFVYCGLCGLWTGLAPLGASCFCDNRIISLLRCVGEFYYVVCYVDFSKIVIKDPRYLEARGNQISGPLPIYFGSNLTR